MGNIRTVHLLLLFTSGQILLTFVYAAQTLSGNGTVMVLAGLSLLAISLAALAFMVWRRAQRQIHVYREQATPHLIKPTRREAMRKRPSR